MKKYRRLEDKPKLIVVILTKGIKKFLKFLVSEEFNQQAMIFKREKEMNKQKQRSKNEQKSY